MGELIIGWGDALYAVDSDRHGADLAELITRGWLRPDGFDWRLEIPRSEIIPFLRRGGLEAMRVPGLRYA